MYKTSKVKIVAVVAVGIILPLSLTTANASSANISHSYNSSGQIVVGSLVSLNPDKSDYVEKANTSNGNQLIGVAVASSNSLLAEDSGEGTVQVATSGNADVLVSDLNGPVDVGDLVSVSPINGVGMRSDAHSSVLGIAQTALNTHASGVITQNITSKSGKSTIVYIGFVSLQISVGAGSSQGLNSSQSKLQQIAKNLTGNTVSVSRILISLIIALFALVAVATLIYASIYSGIISVGRNPLAKYAVFRSVGSVLSMVVLIAIVSALTIVYLLR
jgi:hypothetical protein